VEVPGDSLSIFQHRELFHALHESRVVDGDARCRRERYRKVLIRCTELLGTLFLAEVEIPEDGVADANGDAEERSHARMVRGEPVRLGVRREIAQAKRFRIDDEESKDAVPLGEIPDGGIGLGVDADSEELAQAPIVADDAERPVVSPNEFARRLDDPAQHDREAEIGAYDDDRVDQLLDLRVELCERQRHILIWGPKVGNPVRVFLLDDHEIVRGGLTRLFEREGDIEVVGEGGTAAEALSRIPPTRPDVALLDVRLPDGDGVEVCREIRSRHPEIQCLMLTSFADDEALFDAIMAGASGYILKQIKSDDIVEAVRLVAKGQSLLDPAVTGPVLERLRKGPEEDERLAQLTPQERNILELIADGLTNRQIAGQIHLSEKTVKNYVSNLLSKLGMERRTQAAVYAARLEQRGERPAE
jgi:two-component system, NarL family, response regulator DevR